MKHERFCEALMKKAPDVRLRDILTITSDKLGFVEALSSALDHFGAEFAGYTPTTLEEAETILRVLSVRRDNLPLLASTMAPTPFLFEFSDSAWVQSTAGAQIAPLEFLLNSLKSNFTRDYDRHQQTREHAMKASLRRILTGAIPDVSFVDNVVLRAKERSGSRTLTDIDFVAYERKTGIVLLFQLKHQDRYGADIRRRTNRTSKLRQEVSRWLDAVRGWIGHTSPPDIASALRLPKGVLAKDIRLVVLTRHFAHVVSELDLQDDCVYATWMQLEDALARAALAEKRGVSLHTLFDVLTNYMSHRVANSRASEEDDLFRVRTLSFRVRRSGGDQNQGKPASNRQDGEGGQNS